MSYLSINVVVEHSIVINPTPSTPFPKGDEG